MRVKHYVSDFVEEFNYSGIVLYVADEVSFDDLFLRLTRDSLSHMYHFDGVRDDRVFYIENCDLFAVEDNEIKALLEDDYTFATLHQDENGFYIMVGGK